MADEILKIDENHKNVSGAVTDDSNKFIKMLRIDDATKGLKVSIVGGGGSGTVTSITQGTGILLTPSPITTTGSVALSTTLQPMATLAGNSLKVLRVNAGETAVEYATISTGLTVGTTTIASGASGTVLIDTGGTLGELGYTTTATASKIVERDANANIFINNFLGNGTITASGGATVVLTAASSHYQAISGSSNQTYQLPNATTLSLGPWFTFNNNSSGNLIITDNGGTTKYTVPAGGVIQCGPTDISTANGAWDFHGYFPLTATWSSGVTGLVFNTTLTTTPQIYAGASSSTQPSFIPQRGSSTTGLGGDSTNLYLILGGSSKFSVGSTGHITVEGVTSTGATGTGKLVFDGTPTLVTPVLGTPTSGTLTNCTGLPAASVVAGTFGTGAYVMDTKLTIPQVLNTSNAITASGNAATVPITSKINTVTNNSAATLTITMTTTSAIDGQLSEVRILDFSAVAQTITWVNTENSSVTAPTTSNGSTTLPLSVLFQYNNATSLWRCIASA